MESKSIRTSGPISPAKGWPIYRLLRERSGVTAIEYALIAALIAIAAIAAFQVVGTDLSNTFSSIASQL